MNIDELYADAWLTAIKQLAERINNRDGRSLTTADWSELENISIYEGITFTENGNIKEV